MFTPLYRYIVRLVVFTLVILQISFNFTTALAEENTVEQIKSSDSTETVVPSSVADGPTKSSQTSEKEENSTVRNRENPSNRPPFNPIHRYDMKAIEEFDAELYGN